ncbi:MAG: hypothetical protein K6E47_16240 [Lachnospiraceae bacterium]|nr:hypothetical protein [Lachnospiraceae bacterium]
MKKYFLIICVCILSILFVSLGMNPDIKLSADELDEPIEEENEDPFENVSSARCYASISSGIATVSSEVYGYSGTTSTSVTVYLEKFVAGSWQSYTSWSHNGGQNQSNSDSTSVTSGAYRVWMSVTASGTGGTESFNVDGNTAGC